jgi:hypothetical protein
MVDESKFSSSYLTSAHSNLLESLILLKEGIGKSKVVSEPNQAPHHEDVLGEWRYNSMHLTSALDGGEWPASRSGRFTPKVKAHVTLCIGGWVDPKVGLDVVAKGKKSHNSPCQEWNSGHPAP